MNSKQLTIIMDRVIKDDAKRAAVRDVIFGGLSCYESEQRHHVPVNTLARVVRRVRDEWGFYEKLRGAAV